MEDIILSMILPVYNVEKYIENCLHSIFNQDLERCEVILVDDGTLDKSGEICDKYAMKYKNVKVLHNQNAGSYKTRLIGASVATGEYLWFIDSDDWILDNSIAKLIGHIEDDHYPDVILFDYLVNGKKKANDSPAWSEKYLKGSRKIEVIRALLESDSINAIWRKCIKRDLIIGNELIKEMQGFSFGEDVYISAGVFEKMDSIAIVEDALYAYRVNYSSMTHGYNPRRLGDQRIVFDRLDELAEYNGVEKSVLKNRIVLSFLWDIRLLMESDLSWDDKFNILDKNMNEPYWKVQYEKCDKALLDKESFKIWEIIHLENKRMKDEFKKYYFEYCLKQGIKTVLRGYI